MIKNYNRNKNDVTDKQLKRKKEKSNGGDGTRWHWQPAEWRRQNVREGE